MTDKEGPMKTDATPLAQCVNYAMVFKLDFAPAGMAQLGEMLSRIAVLERQHEQDQQQIAVMRDAIETALLIEDIWCPEDEIVLPEHTNEAQALALMKSKFEAALTTADSGKMLVNRSRMNKALESLNGAINSDSPIVRENVLKFMRNWFSALLNS